MSARLVEIYLPETEIARLEDILARHSRRFWREAVPGGQEKYSCLVQQRYTGRLLDDLDRSFGSIPEFGAYVIGLEAALPAVEETADTELPATAGAPPTALERFFTRDRISTDEIYDDIDQSLHIRPTYLLTVVLSAVIAALGMSSGQTAVVIGAMIIAPLLGPTMGIALAATVGDKRLAHRAGATLAVGCVLAVASGVAVGACLDIDPMVSELRNRTVIAPADVALALACGAAGVLAFSRAASLTLVGVMIAVALVPPLSAAGVYLGAGFPTASASALFLFLVNLVCLNVAGIATFLFQGLPPKSWRITGGIFMLWVIILMLLASLMAGRLVFGLGSMAAIGKYFGMN
ncbi:MAG: TIGR00341 family protein [Sphingobium sp.]